MRACANSVFHNGDPPWMHSSTSMSGPIPANEMLCALVTRVEYPIVRRVAFDMALSCLLVALMRGQTA